MKTLVLLFASLFLLATLSTAFARDVTLAWDASASGNVAGYKLYYQADCDLPPFANIVDVGNVLQFTVTGLEDGKRYSFAATAYDEAGYESGYSNIVTEPFMVAPQGLKITGMQR
jgi:hypothetical protein